MTLAVFFPPTQEDEIASAAEYGSESNFNTGLTIKRPNKYQPASS